MANRYWVGGTGTWNTTSTTNWSASSGGASGASVPTAADSVFFDQASTYTVTMTGALLCLDITVSAGTVTFNTGTAPTLAIKGSMSLASATIWNSTAAITFNSTTTGKTITTNGVTLSGPITLNGVGGGWTLGSALTMNTASYTNGLFTVTNGTFNTGNFNMTLTTFDSSNTNVRSITLGTSTISIARWTFTTISSLTFSGASSTINVTPILSVSDPFNGGGLTYGTVNVNPNTGLGTIINAANTFSVLNIVARTGSAAVNTIQFGASQTITTLTLNAPTSATYRTLLTSTINGTQRTLLITNITPTVTDCDFRDIVISGTTLSGTRIGNGTNCSGITFSTPKTVYWNKAAGGNWTDSDAWATTSGGSTSDTNFPLMQDTAIIENTGLNTSATITIQNGNPNIGSLNASTRTNAASIAQPGLYSVYGDFIMGSGITLSGIANSVSFVGSNNQSVTMNGVTFSRPMIIDKPVGGTVTLNSGFTSSDICTHTSGYLTLSGTTTFTAFNSNNSNSRVINFGTGNITVNGTGTVWTTAVSTGLSVFGTPIVNISNNTATATTIAPGSLLEASTISFNITTGTYTLTISGTYSIKNLDFTGFAGTLANGTGTIYGNLTLATGMTLTAGSGILTFGATSGTSNIISNGKTMDFPVTFGVTSGGTYQLQDTMTLGSSRTATLTAGILNLNNKTLTCGGFNSNNTNTRTIAFGTGNITTIGSGTVFTTASTNNLTVTGTPVVNISNNTASASSVIPGLPTEANSINFNFTTGTYTLTFFQLSSQGSVKNLDFTGFSGSWTPTSSSYSIIYGDLTLSSTMTLGTSANSGLQFGSTSGIKNITTNGKTVDFGLTFNGVGGTWQLQNALTMGSLRTATLTNGTLNLNSKTLTCGAFSSSNSNTRTVAFGTGNITVIGTGTVYATSVGTNFSVTGTAVVNVSNNTATATTVDTGNTGGIVSLNITTGTYTLTLPTNTTFKNIDFTGFSGTVTNLAHQIYGSVTLSSTATYSSGTAIWQMMSPNTTSNITTNGKTIDFPLTINAVGGTVVLQDALTMGSTRSFVHSNGTLDINGKTLTVGSDYTTNTGTKNLTFNGGTLVCPGVTTTAFNNAAPTNYTTTTGTGTGTISMTGATAKTFVGGGSTFNCTLQNSGAGALTISGSNTFTTISNSVQPTTFIFTSGTTTTVTDFNVSGTAGNLVTIGATTTSAATLSKSSGTVTISYCSVSYNTATGGAVWQAYTTNGNVDSGNNLGWVFVTLNNSNFFAFFN